MARPLTHDRDEALDRAVTLFWRKGFHATSLKDIEAALGMRPGSIYAAFGSKDGLYRAAQERYARRMGEALRAKVAEGADPLAGLAAFLRGMGGPEQADAPSRACMLVKSILEMTDEGCPARAEAEALLTAMETEIGAVFAAAQAQGLVAAEADPKLLAAMVQMELIGLRAYAARADAPVAVPALAEALARRVEALRVPGAARAG
ncbi:TetR/AcrR family transcriptional regulator [Rhodovulum sp. DZ06]|uniref:TetR/AcrR family transcriptional regulator n=1 Tax=Rhodovulum sp. DZ06 TaxID=3425126 RepID=UPI003D34DAC2